MAVLGPPPLGQPFGSRSWNEWFQLLWIKLGSGSDNAVINAQGVTGTISNANLPVGLDPTVRNDAIAESEDISATEAAGHVHGGAAGSYATVWNVYRAGTALYSDIAAQSFTGLNYATTYYVSYDVEEEEWVISTGQADVTGPDKIVFTFRTSDSQGVAGDAQSGGGGVADGGRGGFRAGQFGGFGQGGM